jgi:predicted dehydrogenase
VILSAKAGLSWRYPAYEESIRYEWLYFVNDCIREGKPPLSQLKDAMIALKLLEAAEQSIATMRVVQIAS